jgi:DNA-binding beta-propeller fold protein YncE
MKQKINAGLIATMLVLLPSGCAQQPAAIIPQTDVLDLVWPKPPEVPRIRFLYSITEPRDINIRSGWLHKTLDFLKGSPRKQIGSPYGISKDAEGRLYVVDTFYKTVHVFDTEKSRHYLFPEQAVEGFRNPVNIVMGSEGRVFVSDSETGLVHVFTEHGRKFFTSIGKGQLQRPTGLAVNDKTGELLVTDTVASRLVVYDERSLALKRTIGGASEGSEGFHYPTNITVSKDGQIYITDSFNFRILKLSKELEFIRSIGAAGDSPGYFSRPKGVATDSEGNVYVADALFDNIQIFDSDGHLLLAFGGPGHGQGEFWLPNALFIDAEDRIYVSDPYNKRIQVFQFLQQEVK